jgi:hypothetical protein
VRDDSRKIMGSIGVVACALDEGIALLDASRNIYFSLNASGAVVWQLIASPCSIDEICEAVANHFDISADACRDDVVAMVDRLVELKLATLRDHTGT